MTADPRAALTTLVSAFERHLEACSARRGEDDPTVLAAADELADAFEAYDDVLLAAFGEMTPLEVYGDDDDLDDDLDDDEADEDWSTGADDNGDDDEGDEEEDDGDEGDLDDHADEDDDEATYSGFDGDWAPEADESDESGPRG